MVADPYQVLGVSHSATEDEIRQAYRRLAKKYHPDLNPGDAQAAQKMNEVNEAYDLLKNPQAYQQQRAQQQARQAYQQQRQQGYYDPLDPFGFYRSQDGEQNRGSQQSYRTYYYYSTGADGNEDSQPYQWYYQRSTRRSPFGLLGKIIAIFFILTFSSRCSAAAPIVQARIPAIKAAAPPIPSRMAAPARTPAGTGAPTVKTAPVRKAR